MRNRFEEQLAQLNSSLIKMGAMVEKAIADASKALIEQDEELARRVIERDDDIDNMEEEIEKLCLKIILQQQPVARDLRLINSVSKIIMDLERIGDHASDISEIAIFLAGKQRIRKLEHISQMSQTTIQMVTMSVNAFIKKDLDLANEVIAYDEKVDEHFHMIKDELIALIKENTDNSDQAIDLIMIAKYFERIGDHAENVAEWVVFSLTGMHKDIRIM